MLYGRLATSAHGRSGSTGPSSVAQSSVMASPSHHRDARPARPRSRRTGSRWRSTSTAVTVGARLGQGQGERPEPGADLDDPVAGADAGQAGDAAHGVGVGDEVLPEGAAGLQPVARRAARGPGRRGVRHRRPAGVLGPSAWAASASSAQPSLRAQPGQASQPLRSYSFLPISIWRGPAVLVG